MNLRGLSDADLIGLWNRGTPVAAGIGGRDDTYAARCELIRGELLRRNLI